MNVLVKVRVTPGSRRERIERTPQGWRISVREPAERGAANERAREIIAREHGVPLSAVRLAKGHHSPVKIFSIGAHA